MNTTPLNIKKMNLVNAILSLTDEKKYQKFGTHFKNKIL